MTKIDTACIIDDDPIFIFGVKRMMHLSNFCENFIVFHNGKVAIEGIEANVSTGIELPDVILLDLNMPVMDGWQFLDRFVLIPTKKRVAIYIVTSSIDIEDLNKAKNYEAVSNYIVKPISIEKLQGILVEL
ncbi:MAG: CheY-like chemotaxis protein [Roseivirga sp.]|jgi:CheY-like chemotaxis protein